MTRKLQIIAIVLLLLVTGTGIILHNSRQHFHASVFLSGNGWGYDILKGKRIIIHQPFIPCLQGNLTFEDKTTAQRTGNLIVEKLKNRQSPAISKSELEAVLNRKNELIK
jgi:hypothetical protein